jgi:endo-1,4-beta-mannosidase
MYWWQDFDAAEVEQDFSRLADARFQVVRVFLTWEDFQPAPSRVSTGCLNHLVAVADVAANCKIMIQPTFFCGHMSGVNWIPEGYWVRL